MRSWRRAPLLALVAFAVASCLPFKTPAPAPEPAPPAPPAPTPAPQSDFIAFGDFGGGADQWSVADEMRDWDATHDVDAMVTTGDNVYGDATHDEGDPALFQAHLIDPYFGLPPLWVTLGNHDVVDGHGAEQLQFLGLPSVPYAKVLSGVQLLFVDSNPATAAQAAWLDARLSEPGPRLRVVVFHHPGPYNCESTGPDADVNTNFVPVLEQHAVALVLMGHAHHYERFVSPGGVTYVITGGGGQYLETRDVPCPYDAESQAWAELHHFMGIEVSGNKLTLSAVGVDGTVFDQAVITR